MANRMTNNVNIDKTVGEVNPKEEQVVVKDDSGFRFSVAEHNGEGFVEIKHPCSDIPIGFFKMKNRILRTSAETFWSIKQGSRQTQPFLHFRRRWSMCLSWLKMRG